jgi:hypothetical protein
MNKKNKKAEFEEIILKDALHNLEKAHGLHKSPEQSYREFQKEYKKDIGTNFLEQVQRFINNNAANTFKTTIALIIGFSIAFIPTVNMTVRNSTNSLFDYFKGYVHTESAIIDFTQYIKADDPIAKANKIIKEAMRLKLKTNVSYSGKEIRLSISGLKSFDTSQEALKELTNIQPKRQGNILFIIE